MCLNICFGFVYMDSDNKHQMINCHFDLLAVEIPLFPQ